MIRNKEREAFMEGGWNQSKFNETLERYAAVSKRTLPEIVNTKLFYIARKAIWFTPKADAYRIKQELGGIATVRRMGKRGKLVKRREVQAVWNSEKGAPVAALIINARRKAAGEKGLHGQDMAIAVRGLLGGRAKSIGFFKSGWLPTVRELAPMAKDKTGAMAQEAGIRQVGRAKGTAKAAREGFEPVAEGWNLAGSARGDHKGALVKYGQPALDQAFADETASMLEYIERKMRPDAEAFNKAQLN